MTVALATLDGACVVPEAPDGALPPCSDSGAADPMIDGTGLSGREWWIVTVLLLTVSWCVVGGFCLRGWVDAPARPGCSVATEGRP